MAQVFTLGPELPKTRNVEAAQANFVRAAVTV
jgi:hypothetical protein